MKQALQMIAIGAIGILAFLAVIGLFIWGMAAITDASIDCPPGSIIQYNQFGYISQCTVYPPQEPSRIVIQ